MTMIVGWRSGESVFLVSDTGLTRSRPPSAPRSSIGQAQATDSGSVEEGLPKVVPLSDSVAVAYCGDGGPARSLLSTLKEHCSAAPLERLIPRAWMSVSSSATERVEILCAERRDGASNLWRWSSDRPGSVESVSNFAVCGSLRAAHTERVGRLLNRLRENGCSTTESLPVVMAVLHQMCSVNDVVVDNVAGILVGCFVSPSGFHWQEDTTYLLHPPDLALLPRTDSPTFDSTSASTSVGWDLVASVVRDNVVVLHTTVGDRIVAMGDSISMRTSPKEWRDRWLSELGGVFRGRCSRYYVFLNRRSPTVVIVDSPSHSPSNAAFEMSQRHTLAMRMGRELSLALGDEGTAVWDGVEGWNITVLHVE
jgi:hypothetical protein